MEMLVILVEGEDDERFFEKVIKPLLQERYSEVKLWKYPRKKFEKRKSFIKSIKRMKVRNLYKF